MNSKFSIIIPVYNVEKYISKCLDSILNQTFEDFEVICINSNSPDNSMEILSEYAMEDKRIKIICQEDNGPGAARNLGLAHAKGEFISFVDGDDWIEPKMYELIINNMSEEIDIINFSANMVFPDGAKINSLKEWYYFVKYEGRCNIDYNIMKNTTVNIWDKVYRNSIIKKNNINFASNIKYAEDVSFLYKYLLSCENIYFINKCLYNYVQRANSAMQKIKTRNLSNIVDSCNAIFDVYNFLKSKNIFEKNITIFMYKLYNCCYDDYICCNKENLEKMFDKARELILKMDLGVGEKDLFIIELKNKNYSNCIQILTRTFNYELETFNNNTCL